MATIDRSALSGLIPEPVTREIMQGAIAESAVLRMGQLCTMLAVPVGLRRAVSVPLHRVVIGVDLEQHTESVFLKPGMALV